MLKNLTALALAVATVTSLATLGSASDTCSGSGTTTVADAGGGMTLKLLCSGQCSGTSRKCKERSGTGSNSNLKFCGCNSSDIDPDDCCTVVIEIGEDDAPPTAKPYGTCDVDKGCTGGNKCSLSGENQPTCSTAAP